MVTKFEHNLLLHPRTEVQIRNFLSQPAHAVVLVGPLGSGKYSLAKALAAKLLELDDVARLDAYPYYLELAAAEAKQEIPIDAVRAVIAKLQLKTPGTAPLRRVIVVDGTHNLSSEAQNAFLKTLEEPGSDTAFILTAPSLRAIAPTIASRAQTVTVHPVTSKAAQDYYAGDFSPTAITSNWLLSGGAAGLLDSLLKDTAEHPLKDAVADFKNFLGFDVYQKLLYCDSLSRDKIAFAYFLDGGKRVLRALHKNSIEKGHAKRARSINESRKLLNSLQVGLEANGSPRLLALSLALNLKL